MTGVMVCCAVIAGTDVGCFLALLAHTSYLRKVSSSCILPDYLSDQVEIVLFRRLEGDCN